MKPILTSLALFLICSTAAGPTLTAQNQELAVFDRWIAWSDSANALQHHLNGQAFELLEKRRERVRSLTTAADWSARQSTIRAKLEEIVGPFPARNPLNARSMGTVDKGAYRIEKIVFESQPSFYVTGCLFIPSIRAGKAPAILNLIGHTDISFRAPLYQQLILNLVKKGFIVFAMDPIGQGERLQYYDSELKKSVVGGSTTEHTYFGRQSFLIGSSAARYFAWDGIRAIDYLSSRPEVDPARIGVTGISGGGTQTTYVSALDDRVAAAAPTCYIAGYQRLLESIGPQDAEQNFNRGVFHGIDHADLIEVRAPKPTLIVSTTRDFFSIQGARETFAEAQSAFRAAGAGDNLTMVEDDFGHGYTRKTREEIYRFFQKHLNLPGDSRDEELELAPIDQITVTPTGQVGDSLKGETAFSLNRRDATSLAAKLQDSRRQLASHLSGVKKRAAEISGFVAPPAKSESVYRGRHQRDGYFVEMHALRGEGGIQIPLLLMIPDGQGPRAATIYLHPRGKAFAAAGGGEAERLVKSGHAVLLPDLSGIGENGNVNNAIEFLAMHAGRSIVAIRAGEILRCVNFLKARSEIRRDAIAGAARGALTIPLLHAAAFEESIRSVVIHEGLVSFQSVVDSRYYDLEAGNMVANALTAYDLPDLTALLAPRKLLVLNPSGPQARPAEADLVERSYEVVRRSFAHADATDRLSVRTLGPGESLGEVLASWPR